MPDLQNSLRIICAAQILMLFTIVLSRSRSQKALVLLAFFISVMAYVLRTFFQDDSEFGALTWLVYGLVFAVGPLLLFLARAIFDDEFSLFYTDLVHLLIVELLNFIYFFHFVSKSVHWGFSDKTEPILFLNAVPYIIQLVYATWAVMLALKGRAIDLINERINFRWRFIIAISLAVISISLVELIFIGTPDSILVHNIFLLVIISLCLYVAIELFAPIDTFFIKTENPVPVSFQDELVEKFQYLVENEKIFLQPDLTVEKIADQLGEPVYKVRKLINSRLNFRNFNEFLNHYRVEEAKLRLKDDPKAAVIDIAFALGYNSLAPFNKAFKRLTNRSPTEFRSQTP